MNVMRQATFQRGEQKQTRTGKLEQALQQTVNFVQEQSLAEVQSLLETLEQQGEIGMDLLPDYENEEQLEDVTVFDAEMSLADEDAPVLEESPLIDGDFGDGPFMSGGEAEIQIIIGDDGRAKCVPPDNEWVNARHSSTGKIVLDALNTRFQVFEVISKWLEHEENSILTQGAESFLSRHKRIPQMEFFLKYWEELGLKDQDRTDSKKIHNLENMFSLCIRNAFLSWQDASIPLRKLFS